MRSLDDDYIIELTAFGYTFFKNTEAEMMASKGDIEITWEEITFQPPSGQAILVTKFTVWNGSGGMGYEKELESLIVDLDGESGIEFNELLQKYRK